MPTIRQQIISLLSLYEMDALQLSQELGVQEKEVYDHLDHIARSLAARGEKACHPPQPVPCLRVRV